FEPCRVQNKCRSRLAGDSRPQKERTKKSVSQLLASFEVQIAAEPALPTVNSDAPGSILGAFDDGVRDVPTPSDHDSNRQLFLVLREMRVKKGLLHRAS